jgi:hypothetical protein
MVRSRITSLISLVAIAGLLLGGSAGAATKSKAAPAAPQPVASNGSASDNGLKVSPVRTDVTIKPGATQIVVVTVTNVTSAVAAYQVQVNDFTASGDESGQPQILLDATKFAPSHSLKRLVGAIPNVTLQPGETKNINVPVSVPKDYSAGGYYGAVRFAPHSSDNAAGKQVTLSASVGSLVLVTVPGDINEVVSVASLDARKTVGANQIDSPRAIFTTNKNINAVIRFQNGGDVQEQPFGKLVVKNWRGKVLASYEINNETPRGNVLPDSIRKFQVPLTKLGSFGKYTMVGNFGYGSSGQLITASSSFYLIPLYIIILAVLIVAAILFLIFGLPRVIKRYNRRVVSRSQSNRKR